VSFINEHRERFGVEPICDTLQVAPSTYYAALSRPASARQVRDSELKVEIARVHQENFDVYGTEKVWKQLQRESVEVGRDRVGRLLAELELGRGGPRQDLADHDSGCGCLAAGRLGRPNLQYDSTQPTVGCRPHLRQHLAGRCLHDFR
jgi:helix-turn-helix protein